MSLVERLKRSNELLPEKFKEKIFNRGVSPNWIGNEEKFWYVVNTKEGKIFYNIDIEKKQKELLFDHNKIAEGLKNVGIECEANNLPITAINITPDGSYILTIGYDQYSCTADNYECKKIKTINSMDFMGQAFSPNGKYSAYVKKYNLYIKDLTTGEEIQLSKDGVKDYGYGILAGTSQMNATLEKNSMKAPPAVLWSPDGNKILTHRTDERKSKEFQLLHSAVKYGEIHKAYSYKTALPGEEVPQAEFVVYDIETRIETRLELETMDISLFGTPLIGIQHVWWNVDNRTIYLLYPKRGYKELTLYKTDVETGETKKIITESGKTYLDVGPMMTPIMKFTSDNKEIIWFSERDGWGHLYLYDAETGQLKNQITTGEFVVFSIIHIDEVKRNIYFSGIGREEGRDPYYEHIYKVNFDGSGLKLLTPENSYHSTVDIGKVIKTQKFEVKISPGKKYFIDTYSSINTPPTSVIRDMDGNIIMELEQADISPLKELGWTPPEPFSVKGRDGKTDIYGVIFKPSDFNPDKKYPVIDDIYPGPQSKRTPKTFDDMLMRNCYALAELGFIVICIDGMGTPMRSKAFHDVSYNNMREATLIDHKIAIKELAKDRPYIDLKRVGIIGISAGGYGTCCAMFDHGDFYKVGVACNIMVDFRYYMYLWGEKYLGYPVDDKLYNENSLLNMVDGLKGRLLIIFGAFDENINAPTQMMLIDKLIKAGKEFDSFIIPNGPHNVIELDIYIKKQFNYLLKHLKGEEIPLDFNFPY